MKSIAVDRKLIAFDTKSNGNYRRSIRNQQEVGRTSIAFYKTSIAFDAKSNGNCRTSTRNNGKHYEISVIRYQIKWKM